MVVESECIKLSYSPKSPKAVYDICDMNGSILETGKLRDDNEMVIDTSELPAGNYMLYILDAGEVISKRFTKKD